MVLYPPSNYQKNILGNGNGMSAFRPQLTNIVQSWQDLPIVPPVDPKSFILNTLLGATQATWQRSTNMLGVTWVASPLALTGSNTKVTSLDTTDAATAVEVLQWNTSHQMVNATGSVPPALSKVIYLKAGYYFDNQIEINFGGSSYNNVQLTLRDNLATSGSFLNASTGGIPSFLFGSSITGNQILHVQIAQPGIYNVVIAMVLSGNWNAFEMEWIVLP